MLKFLKHHWNKREKFLARWSFVHLALALCLGILVAGLLIVAQNYNDAARVNALKQMAEQVQPATQNPPGTKPIGGPFALVNQDGKAVTDADYQKQFKLIYFGYTYCPDMCPTGLQSMAKALDQLGPDSAKVAPLFVTIDPVRDTPQKLKEYVAQFHPQIQGLTGTEEQVAKAAAAYQVYYAKGEQVDDHDYVMDHSSMIYLMAPDGKFITTFPEDVDPAVLVKAIQASR